MKLVVHLKGSILFVRLYSSFLYTYFKNFVGENDECQLSNGDCTTEKKYRYWILIGNNLPWCRLHTVPTFDDESYGLSKFFIIQWLRLHCSWAFVKGQWNATFLNFWWRVMLSRSRLAVRTAPREELTVFAYQIWKPQFLSVVQYTFNDCYSPFPLTTFLEMGVYTKSVDSVERARWVATQTPGFLCYSPPNNSRGICAWKCWNLCWKKWIKVTCSHYIIFLV